MTKTKSQLQTLFNVIPFLCFFSSSLSWSQSLQDESLLLNTQLNLSPTIKKEISREEKKKKRHLRGHFQAEMGTKSMGESQGVQNYRYGYTQLTTLGQLDFSHFLTSRLQLLFNFREGYSQNKHGPLPVSEESRFYMKEAVVVFDPLSLMDIKNKLQIEVSGPVVNQAFLEVPMMISKQTGFYGVSEKLTWNRKNLSFQFIAQQSFPASQSRYDQAVEKEKVPFFLTETLKVQSQWINHWKANFFLSHYSFTDLPSSTAIKSSALGNSTTQGSHPGSKFVFDLNGVIFDINGCYCIPELEIHSGYQFMHNLKANVNADSFSNELNSDINTPFLFWSLNKINQSGRFYLKAKLRFLNISLEPLYEYYTNGKDVSPAIYQDSIYGSASRKGNIVQLGVFFEKWGFGLIGQYTQSEVMIGDSNLSDISDFQMSLKTRRFTF